MSDKGMPPLLRTSAMALALGMFAAPALATNGYIANGYGGPSKGMAGAGVAVSAGLLGLAQNPAFGTRVGNTAGFCLTTFAPDRGFSVDSAAGPLVSGTQKSKNDVFFIPCGGVNFSLSERSSLGIIAFGNGGMNTEYNTNVFQNFDPVNSTSPLGVNLEQLFIAVNYAYDVNEQLTVGVAPILAIQRFSATGLQAFDNAFFTSDVGSVTNNGDDWSSGLGLNLGMVWEPNEQWRFGFSYRSRIYMEKFNKYSGLFAEQGDFDIPAVATLGAAYTLPSNPDVTLTAEYQRIFYSDINSISNSNVTLPNTGSALLGTDSGPGFGWKDMDVIRVAGIWKANEKWTFRGGVSYATQFIDNGEALLNVLAPATPRWHASLGASYKVNENWGITAAYTHAFESSVTGTNMIAAGQPVKLRMDQNEFSVGMTYKW
ncbi:putative facilitator of salicylate uptake [Rhodovulum sp. P5]|uniref:OmpP1/FadL family transporter n=1 Tax=Rhodovulum sp. P5 TaxID=1564506 RepID=UPI0009C39E0E|nr:outer membrane protein transport protein [Rhodovulum sp. P5]ARE39427.1 putative facilitator of salicylate uptake [Rhodovulum sp. P5]